VAIGFSSEKYEWGIRCAWLLLPSSLNGLVPCGTVFGVHDKLIPIGVLGDMFGPYAVFGGKGAILAVQTAVPDFGFAVLGKLGLRRHRDAFVAVGSDRIAALLVDVEAADVGHEDARLAGDVRPHIP